jgi:NTP pyrophosphatase (non-canonical NTP hydrolase)
MLTNRASEIREKYKELELKKYGKLWTNEQIAIGLVGDVGELLQLILAKEGVRNIENADEKLKHELSDCLWAIFVIAKNYNVDLEKAFFDNMSQLEKRISSEK